MKKHTTTTPIRTRRKPLITALEPRILLDGAAVVTMAEMATDVAFESDAVHNQGAEQSVHFAAPAPVAAESSHRREVAFVDTSVNDYQSLVDGLGDGVEVILINGNDNGLEQMVASLQGQSGIDAIHLFSHGSVGELKLGTLTLNADSVQANAELLSTLGASLTETGDLMLYGCYVGADSEGQSFIDSIASLTLADVAASEDLTGAEGLGGNWVLEAESGLIETSAAAVAGFDGVLAPTVKAVADSVTYTEGGAPVLIDTGINFSGGGDYREGYIRFTLDNATTSDSFVLNNAPNVNATDAISVIGNDVYRGNGTGRERIGSIDSVENGTNGKSLKILLSTPLPNSGFEEGAANWTLSSEVYGDNNNEINFDNYNIPLANNSDSNSTYTGGTGRTNTQAPSSFTPKASIDSGSGVGGSKALYLQSSGEILKGDQADRDKFKQTGYGSIHGPYATSTVITVESGDSISLDFKAVGNSDDYEVFGLLRKVDSSGNFLSNDKNNSNNVILFAQRGADTGGFVRVDKSGLSAGSYRFQFVGGTYDGTGGLAVGSNLYVDNIRLISNKQVTDSIVSKIASQVAYSSTANDTKTERNITISAQDSRGGVGSDAVKLLVTQVNNAPTFSGDASLSAVNEDTAAPSGSSVSNLFSSKFIDPDTAYEPADTLAGIIITADASNPAQGEWQYSTNGSDWHVVGNVTSSAGLLLSSASSLRFVPAADYNGTPGSLRVHAVDSSVAMSFTSGATRATFNTSVAGSTGGITAISAAAVSLKTSITAVNDAPVLAAPVGATIVDTDQLDTFANITGTLTASDIDTDAADLRFGIDDGLNLVVDGSLAGSYGTLKVVKETGAYTYIPNSAAINALNSETTDTFTVTVSDGTTTVTQVLTFNIEGANDAPVFGTIETVDTTTIPPSMGNATTPGAGIEILDNGLLKFGNGTQESLNALTGMLEQPWYYDSGTANKLTYSQYALNFSLGVNGDGANDWNLNGDVNLAPKFTNVSVDTSGFSKGSGTLIWRGDITINGAQLQLTHVYTLSPGSAFLETRTYVTNIGANNASNLRVWVGTQDDYIAGSDSPAKQKGNLVGGEFNVISSAEQQAQAIKIYSADTAVLFFSTSDKANTIIGQHYGWDKDDPSGQDTPSVNPQESVYEQGPDDGGYALFVRLDDLGIGESQSFDWYYAAGSSSQIDAIISDVAAAASANLVEGSGQLVADGDYTVSDVDAGDVVTVKPTSVRVQRLDSSGNIMALDGMPDQATLLSMLSVNPETVIDAASTSGNFNWTFNAGSEGFNFLAQGETLTLTYTLTADDGNGGTAEQTVEVNIDGMNDAPVAQSVTQEIAENGLYEGSVPTASDVDGTIASYLLVSSVASGRGSLTFNSNGSYTFDPGTAFDSLAVGESADVSFTYQAKDNSGAVSNTATITLTVVGSNDVPVVSASAGATSENGQITSNVPAASDVDGTIESYQVVENVSSGSLTFSTDGSYNFDTDTDFDDLAVGESRQVSFTYTATDNDGGISTPGKVTFTITGTNDAPTITAVDVAGAITDGVSLTDTGSITFADLDLTDRPTASEVTKTVTAKQANGTTELPLTDDQKTAIEKAFSITPVDGNDNNGTINWAYNIVAKDLEFLATGEVVTAVFTITVNDGKGGTATENVTVTLTGSNDVPVITVVDVDGAITDDGSLTDAGAIQFADLDLTDRPTASEVTKTVTAKQANGTTELPLTDAQKAAIEKAFSIAPLAGNANNGTINWAYDIAAGDLEFLATGEVVTAVFTITVDDGQGGTATQDVSVTLTGSNDVPVITVVDVDAAITDGVTLTDAGSIQFADLDLTDRPTASEETQSVTALRADGSTPLVLSSTQQQAIENAFSIKAADANTNNGTINWAYDIAADDLKFLAKGEVVTAVFTITVDDGQGGTATQDVSVTLTGSNDMPVITVVDVDGAITDDGSLTDAGAIQFADLDLTDRPTASEVTKTVTAKQANGTTELPLTDAQKAAIEKAFSIAPLAGNANNGTINWAYDIAAGDLEFLATGEVVTAVFTITVDDGQGGTATQDVSVTLTGSNDVPVITVVDVDAAITDGVTLTDAGSIQFADLDLTDRPTASEETKSVTALRADGTTLLVLSSTQQQAIENAFSIKAADANTNNGTINWAYDIAADDLKFLAKGEVVTAVFTITVDDGQGGTATQDVSVTLTGSNDDPVINIDAPTDFIEQTDAAVQDLTQSGQVHFSDVDLTDSINISFVSNKDIKWTRADNTLVADLPTGLAGALVKAFTTGADSQPHEGQIPWTYNASALNLDFLNAGDTITFSYTVTVTDSQDATASQVVTIRLLGTNDAPELTAYVLTKAETIVQKGADYKLDAAQLFSDKDSTLSREDLDFNITGLPAGLRYNPETGVISGKSTESGKFQVTVTATDAEGSSISRTYELLVTAVVQGDTPSVPRDTTPISAPSVEPQQIKITVSDMPSGLLSNSGSQGAISDSSGYMASSSFAGSESLTFDSTLSSTQGEPLDAGMKKVGATEQVILSERGALVIQTQNPDGKTSVRASVDVSVMRDGVVVFTDVQREAFSSVALAVVSIERTADKVLTVTIQDTRQTGSSQVYTGSLSNGESLPSWIKLDPNTGTLTLSNRPAGQKEVSVRIQTIGSDGQARVLELNLDLDELFEGSSLVTDPALIETEGQEPIGFVPLSDQLEAELTAHNNYGDRLMALLQSA